MRNKNPKNAWKIARPFLVELVLICTEYIFKKDEEYNTEELMND